jgi:hypothetical protein
MAGFGGVGRDWVLAGLGAVGSGFAKDGAVPEAVGARFAADGAGVFCLVGAVAGVPDGCFVGTDAGPVAFGGCFAEVVSPLRADVSVTWGCRGAL